MAGKRKQSPARPAHYYVSLARWLAHQFEAFARTIEFAENNGHAWDGTYRDELERLEKAEEAWRDPGPIKPGTWHPIGAARLLDLTRKWLLECFPDFDARHTSSRQQLTQGGASLIGRMAAGDPDGLARIPQAAWESALLEWRSMERRRRGGARQGPKGKQEPRGYHEILFDLMKSGGLAANVKTARNLAEAIEKRTRK